jgi:thiol:disulfide interchange protein DsbD
MVPVALFFLAMAASMFGAFELALPSEVQGRLSRVGGKGPLGAYLMGLVAGIIAAPCTGPPLAALLVFVSTQRSVFIGGSLLFVYALGMGVLFFAIAGFALRMPKSGAWMDAVKSAFGVIMIVAALYFLRNVAAPLRGYGRAGGSSLLFHGAIAATGILIGALHLSFHDSALRVARKLLGILLLTFGLFGIVASLLAPVASSLSPMSKAGDGLRKPQLTWLTDEPLALKRAQDEHKPLLIDFGAEWCLPCKELELKTFSDPAVIAELGRYILLKVDCTDETPVNQALTKKYAADTFPAVFIYDSSGQKILKLSEFTPPSRLLPILQKTH